jgi:REP element-mobilizing transposase RayT
MTLSKIIQQYKRAVTINIKTSFLHSNFNWQRSFYDRIIRNENELLNIRRYIRQNPLKWELANNIDNLEI